MVYCLFFKKLHKRSVYAACQLFEKKDEELQIQIYSKNEYLASNSVILNVGK